MSNLIRQRYLLLSSLLTLGLILLANGVIYYQATALEYVRSEETLIEWTQEIMLALMILVAGYAAIKHQRQRELFVAIAAVAAMMLIREQNNWFKAEMFSGAWQLCVAGILLPASAYLVPRRRAFAMQLKSVMPTSAATTGLIGLFVLLFFSRFLGMKAIWEGIMAEQFVYGVKMLMEESAELLGYSLMMAGTCNLVLHQKAVSLPMTSRQTVEPSIPMLASVQAH